ncbi:MAG: hypothetical protein AMS23_06905 [Bacteroides sp. SM1_62]|nr:MAG: hypothetical protein AMS26_12765 [Bacteroides sp. SM23_62]KPL23226.1 MAG: hypothetical protein AMS23_06905 [Bacteroides sp. SM1_62]
MFPAGGILTYLARFYQYQDQEREKLYKNEAFPTSLLNQLNLCWIYGDCANYLASCKFLPERSRFTWFDWHQVQLY